MNYRHAFHAGNFGDVFKHVVLLRLLRAVQRKAKGFLYLDTHAGRGGYDLLATPPGGRAARAPEWPEGIGRLWSAARLPPALEDYVTLVRRFNEVQGMEAGSGALRYYPGSPWLAALVQRPQDRLALWELHAQEAASLRADLGGQPRTAVTCADGYGALRALLPPPERRALVLIDPPFEADDEFTAIAAALAEGLARLAGGVFAVWYPVSARAAVDDFRLALRRLPLPPTFWTELTVTGAPQVRLKGCGLIILNPPWQVAAEIERVLPVLLDALRVDAGAAARCDWLVPES